MKAAFVTGGGGYVGSRLCRELSGKGCLVTAYDLHFLNEGSTQAGVRCVVGDVRDKNGLVSALRASRADVVFHIASYGMSGREQLNRKLIEEVNVGGTRNVLEACGTVGVRLVVYTSTFNVVFGGQEIRAGREDALPYFPLHKHVDHYSRTKSIAEQEVLAANGRLLAPPQGEKEEREVEEEKEMEELEGGGGGEVRRWLQTCALRCAGIYGEGEQRHLPRIVSYMERGLFQFTYGPEDSLVEFLHCDNFVQAHIKAAEAMETHNSPVAGEAYFISDGAPINNFEFFRPLTIGLGFSYPTRRLPLTLIYYTAFLIEIIHAVVGRYVYNFQPLLTRAEVFKTGVTHYFSLDKARAHFGFSPEPRDLARVVDWFRERGRDHQTQSTTHHHLVTAGASHGVQQTCTDTAGGCRPWVVIVLIGCTAVLAVVASHLYIM